MKKEMKKNSVPKFSKQFENERMDWFVLGQSENNLMIKKFKIKMADERKK